MLSARHRLRRSADFDVIFRRGVRVGRPIMVVHLLRVDGPDATDEPASVGFVVGRAAGGAVARNAVRRRLRHLMAARLERLPAGSRWVIRALPGSAGAPSAVLARELDIALDKALARAEKRR